jgi:hypothetical protein
LSVELLIVHVVLRCRTPQLSNGGGRVSGEVQKTYTLPSAASAWFGAALAQIGLFGITCYVVNSPLKSSGDSRIP